MKRIQKILLAAMITLVAPAFTACTDYQDEIDALDYRITVLENLVKRWNADLESMQVIVNAMEDGDYITNVTESSQGYIITFNESGAIIIKDGKDGIDGKDGKDAQTPDISVKQGEDGYWYWTLNGEFITNSEGDIVRANGKDGQDGKDGKDGENGKDGQNGKDGKDAVSPQVRINEESGIWEISIDNGVTWISTGTFATGKDGKDGENGKDGKDGENGKDGKDGIDGKDGKDGENGKDGLDGKDGKDGVDGKNGKDGIDGNQFFSTIYYEVNSEGEFMVIVTRAGQTFRIPIYKNS